MTEPNTVEGGPYNERRYYGYYRGTVEDVKDPERLGRIKCRVLEILGLDLITDWAWPSGAWYGGKLDYGHFLVPEKGSTVYVQFESGDVNRPIYSAIWWGHKKGEPPEPPKLTRTDKETTYKDDDSTKSPKGDDGWETADCQHVQQPKSPLIAKHPPEYPFNQVLKTWNEKLIVEIDDTKGAGRFHMWHGPTKSWAELDKDGELSVRVTDKSHWLYENDDRHHIKGAHHLRTEKNMTHFVGADRWLQVKGEERRILFGKRGTWVLGKETRVNSQDYSHWVNGNRIDVVLGNWTQFVMGNFTANVFGIYERIAAKDIIDKASKIFHRGNPKPAPPPPAPPTPCSPRTIHTPEGGGGTITTPEGGGGTTVTGSTGGAVTFTPVGPTTG